MEDGPSQRHPGASEMRLVDATAQKEGDAVLRWGLHRVSVRSDSDDSGRVVGDPARSDR